MTYIVLRQPIMVQRVISEFTNKNMKIAVFTLDGYKNNGNRLQMYALVKTLNEMGNDVSTIVVKISPNKPTFLQKMFKKIKNYSLIPIIFLWLTTFYL
jgi:hypothetical protein